MHTRTHMHMHTYIRYTNMVKSVGSKAPLSLTAMANVCLLSEQTMRTRYVQYPF